MAKSKQVKITTHQGIVTFAAYNEGLYKNLNVQNAKAAADRKQSIEIVDVTDEEIQEQSGFDEKALLKMNPTANKLVVENEASQKRIADLEAELAAAKKAIKAQKKETDLEADKTPAKDKTAGTDATTETKTENPTQK